MTIEAAIVTSVWGAYGHYLPAWARSVAAQTLLPTEVAIIDFGITDKPGLDEAVDILYDVADRVEVIVGSAPFFTLGGARNEAVSRTTCEWVIHLDADDELLPHALADVDEVHEGFDVVSLGAIQNGKPRVFPNITGEKILAREHGMFSCGAFRREFWEKRPWHTHNNWVDSTFWVGLAHLGAKFTSTGKVGFVYNQHSDSISHSLTPLERRRAMQQWLRACDQWTLN